VGVPARKQLCSMTMLSAVGQHSFCFGPLLLYFLLRLHHTLVCSCLTTHVLCSDFHNRQLSQYYLPTMRPAFSLLRTCVRASAPHSLKASHAEHIPTPAKRLLHTLKTSPATRPAPASAPAHALSRLRIPSTIRFESTSSAPKQPSTSTTAPESRLDREQVPSYELTFTCNVCKTRSSHRLSKQGYHKGTVLISCPDCKNRHLISDHLKVGSQRTHNLSSYTDSGRYSQISPSQ
jgi:hypothetical protein